MKGLLHKPHSLIMGIINTTPNSFSDGGEFFACEQAFKHGMTLADQGADILDIGGESTRPGAKAVSLQKELDRVIPVIERLASNTNVPISIDTYKPEVMSAAVAAGAGMINDINALQADGALEAASAAQVPVCLMHKQGQPKTMQQSPQYHDVLEQVIGFLAQRINACEQKGIDKQLIVADPGIGFGKTLQHNLTLLNSLPEIKNTLQCELLIGVSRKSLIDGVLGRAVDQRLSASLALATQAVLNGAKLVRVHDVQATVDAIRCVEAVQDSTRA